MDSHEIFLNYAIEQALQSQSEGSIPIGAGILSVLIIKNHVNYELCTSS